MSLNECREMSVVKSCTYVSKDTIVKHYFRRECSEVLEVERDAINSGEFVPVMLRPTRGRPGWGRQVRLDLSDPHFEA